MQCLPTPLPGVLILEPRVLEDDRGFFLESWNARDCAALGIPAAFVQDNHSHSRRHVLRGLHYQVRQPQGKLVRVSHGEVFDVAVDVRRGSRTFGQWFGLKLSAANHRMLWIPPGLAHGVFVLSETADLHYKCSDYYAPEWERTLLWSDATLAIAWPVPPGATPLLSTRDAQGQTLAEAGLHP